MLLSLQHALCPGPVRALRDLPPQRGAAAPAAAVALRLSPGAPHARRVGISLSAGAGRASRVSACAAVAASRLLGVRLEPGAFGVPGDPLRARRVCDAVQD